MNIRLKREAAVAVLLIVMIGAAGEAAALVNMSLSEEGGAVNLERNGRYTIECRLSPDQSTAISQVYAYVRYRKEIFTDVVLTDHLDEVCPINWETDYTNPAFEDDGTWITAQYLMANTEGDDWSAADGDYLVYTLSFRVKADAPLISTNVNFTQSATISDDEGGNVTGSITNYSYTVVLDTTAPETEASPAGGYYNTDRNVSLSINEPGTIYWKVGASSSYAEYGTAIGITGSAGTVTERELYFFGVDEPVGTTPNQEPANLETYHIDKEPPVVSDIAADPSVIGMGGEVDISFEVADLSGVLGNEGRPDYVRLGGREAEWVTGSAVGTFLYRIAVTGAESDGDITVGVTDAAGNFSVQTAADAVAYDLDGPVFTIEQSPDPIYLEELLTLIITAGEALSGDKPDVTVGGEDAGYNNQEGLEYVYTYFMTGRDWEANFDFLDLDGDEDEDGLPNWWENNYGLDPNSAAGSNGARGDPDSDGWTNLAEYQFFLQAGKLADPTDSGSGGQAIPLHRGWNLISYTVNKSWYKAEEPTGLLSGVSKEQVEAGDWQNFYDSRRFKDSRNNFSSAMVRHPTGDWKYYGQFQPDWQNSLDYKSPDQGLWVNMAAADTLIMEGPRVSADLTYPAIGLSGGWNLVSILPRTCFYVEGYSHDAQGPSDLVDSRGYGDVEEMLKAAFNLSDTDFNKIESVQVMYPAPYGVRAYDTSVPWFFWSLKFIQPGVGCWIKLQDGSSINLNYKDPE